MPAGLPDGLPARGRRRKTDDQFGSRDRQRALESLPRANGSRGSDGGEFPQGNRERRTGFGRLERNDAIAHRGDGRDGWFGERGPHMEQGKGNGGVKNQGSEEVDRPDRPRRLNGGEGEFPGRGFPTYSNNNHLPGWGVPSNKKS